MDGFWTLLGLLKYPAWISFTIVLAVVIFKILEFFKVKRYYQDILQGFDGPKPHWLLGNIPMLPHGIEGLEVGCGFTKQYGGLFILWFGNMGSLQCTSPETVRVIMNTAEPKDPIVYSFVVPWIGDGLLVSKGPKWQRNRKLLTPSFHFDILRPYVALFSKSANIMVTKWKGIVAQSNDSLEMFDHVSLMTLDSLLQCIFGYSGPCIQTEAEGSPYISAVYELSQLAIRRFRFPPHHSDLIYYLSPSGRKFKKACGIVHEYSSSVVAKRREEKETLCGQEETTEKKYKAFIDMLLDARDEDGNGLTDTEIQHEVDTFMFEGHDTTASGISWCCYNLAKHPQYQETCREEINALLGDREEVVYEDLSKLPYLTQCIRESMRITPPVPVIARETTKPATFPDGRTLPAGAWVGLGIYQVHHNEKVWDNPKIYDPERFNKENSAKRDPFAFIPFSAGPRNCIGQNFAMNELKVSMALILKNFKLTIDESKPAKGLPELVLRTKDGMWIYVTPI